MNNYYEDIMEEYKPDKELRVKPDRYEGIKQTSRTKKR